MLQARQSSCWLGQREYWVTCRIFYVPNLTGIKRASYRPVVGRFTRRPRSWLGWPRSRNQDGASSTTSQMGQDGPEGRATKRLAAEVKHETLGCRRL